MERQLTHVLRLVSITIDPALDPNSHLHGTTGDMPMRLAVNRFHHDQLLLSGRTLCYVIEASQHKSHHTQELQHSSSLNPNTRVPATHHTHLLL